MGRKPCCAKVGLSKGVWCVQEDELLTNDIKKANGEKFLKELVIDNHFSFARAEAMPEELWAAMAELSEARHKERSHFCEEEDLIIRLHKLLGRRCFSFNGFGSFDVSMLDLSAYYYLVFNF